MRVQAFMFYGTALFFLVTDVVYWLWSKDWTGTTALGLAVGLAGLIGFYTHFTIRRLERANNGPLYEDDPEGEISDAAGEVGFFSPHSWWPLFVAMAVAFTAVGVAVGWWMTAIGFLAIMLTVIGWVFEYYRGEFQH